MLVVVAVVVCIPVVWLALTVSRRRPTIVETPGAAPLRGGVPLDELVEKGGNASLALQGEFTIRSDLQIPDGFVLHGSLVLGPDASLEAPAEVFGTVTLGERATLRCPVLVHGDLVLGRNARCMAAHVEGNAFLNAGAAVDGALRCAALHLEEEDRGEPVRIRGAEAASAGGEIAA
jgi:carbonic anhydrase/acetyltransferase-like protein (isoleucine patch superfamily)